MFDKQISEFDANVKAELRAQNAELQIYKNDTKTLNRLYESVKITNQDLQIRLDLRNKEFVEFRKSVNADMFKDFKMQQHIDYEVVKIQSRYESTLETYRQKVDELAEKCNGLKN